MSYKDQDQPRCTEAALGKVLYPPFNSWAEKTD